MSLPLSDDQWKLVDTVRGLHYIMIINTHVTRFANRGLTKHKNHFEIYLLTGTLTDKDNPLSDTLLSDNSSNNQDTLLKSGEFVS